MANIIVSAHGGRWSDQKEDLEIPSTSEVVFYVADGGLLSNQDGYDILGKLVKGTEPGGKVVGTVSGASTYDYSCWFAEEFEEHCGIFEVGTGKLLKDLSAYTEKDPLLLKQILSWFPNCTIYWLCCREVTKRGTSLYLENSAGAHPSGVPWKAALHVAVDELCDKLS